MNTIENLKRDDKMVKRTFHRELEKSIGINRKPVKEICPNCYNSTWKVERFFRICKSCNYTKFDSVDE